MLHAETLNKLLSQNTDIWVAYMLVFTPDGVLLGNSEPANERDLRNKVSILSQAWQTYNNTKVLTAVDGASKTGTQTPAQAGNQALNTPQQATNGVKAIMIEMDKAQIMIQLIKPKMLLAIIGPSSPLEGMNPPDPATVQRTPKEQQDIEDIKFGSLGILRRKSDAMLAYLQEELKDFEMPEEM